MSLLEPPATRWPRAWIFAFYGSDNQINILIDTNIVIPLEPARWDDTHPNVKLAADGICS